MNPRISVEGVIVAETDAFSIVNKGVVWEVVVHDGVLDIHRAGPGFSHGLVVRPHANNRVEVVPA